MEHTTLLEFFRSLKPGDAFEFLLKRLATGEADYLAALHKGGTFNFDTETQLRIKNKQTLTGDFIVIRGTLAARPGLWDPIAKVIEPKAKDWRILQP